LFRCLKNLSMDNSKYSPKFYRIINEVPTLLLVGIIFAVVFKPL
jgi:putative membrane protein